MDNIYIYTFNMAQILHAYTIGVEGLRYMVFREQIK